MLSAVVVHKFCIMRVAYQRVLLLICTLLMDQHSGVVTDFALHTDWFVCYVML